MTGSACSDFWKAPLGLSEENPRRPILEWRVQDDHLLFSHAYKVVLTCKRFVLDIFMIRCYLASLSVKAEWLITAKAVTHPFLGTLLIENNPSKKSSAK